MANGDHNPAVEAFKRSGLPFAFPGRGGHADDPNDPVYTQIPASAVPNALEYLRRSAAPTAPAVPAVPGFPHLPGNIPFDPSIFTHPDQIPAFFRQFLNNPEITKNLPPPLRGFFEYFLRQFPVPTAPATPATPATPGTPATPATPATPGTPATPTAPATPTTPGVPGSGGGGGGGRGIPGRRDTGDRPDFPGMPDWMRAMPPEVRRMFPMPTGNERRPGGPIGDNVPAQPAPGPVPDVAPGSVPGGGGAPGPDVPAAAPATPPPGGPAAPVAPVAPGAVPTPSVPAEPAPGSAAAPTGESPDELARSVGGIEGYTIGAPGGSAPFVPPAGPSVDPNAPATPGTWRGPLDTERQGALGPIGRQREAVSRETSTKETAAMAAAQAHNFGQPLVPQLADQRRRFAAELSNPALREKLYRIMVNEQRNHPQGVQGIVENVMNRALVRGTTLATQLRWHKYEPNGYYAVGKPGIHSNEYKRYLPTLDRAIQNSFAGGNITNFATDNASGKLARDERASGAFRFRATYGGETFFAPGTSQRSLARRWDQWVAGMQAPQAPTVVPVSR